VRGSARACVSAREPCSDACRRAGRSFQQVLEEARHELARHYLASSPLELNETAYLLGYEDASSFKSRIFAAGRAFHRRTGEIRNERRQALL